MRDFLYLCFLIFISVVAVHLFPAVKVIVFIILLILFYRSKKDYVWLIYIMIIMQAPGGLFGNPYINFIQITSTVGISFVYAFIAVAFIKHLGVLRKNISKPLFNSFTPIPLYIVFLVFISLYIGMDIRSYLQLFYVLLCLILFITIPSIFKHRVDFIAFLKLLYASVFFLFAWQLYDVLFTTKIALLVGVDTGIYDFGTQQNDELIRIYYSPNIGLLALISSLYFLLESDKNPFKKKLLYTVALIAFFSMFLTATRGYIIQYGMLIVAFIILLKQQRSVILVYAISLIIVLFFVFPTVSIQFELAWERFLTLGELLKGDITVGGTVIRLTDRAPRVWNKFIENPIFGFGYSSTGLKYNDGHVGNYTLLLQGGFLGFLIYSLVILSLIIKIIKRYISSGRRGGLLLVMSVLGLMFAHSTSSQVFTYYLEPHLVTLFSVFLLFCEYEFPKNPAHEVSGYKSFG